MTSTWGADAESNPVFWARKCLINQHTTWSCVPLSVRVREHCRLKCRPLSDQLNRGHDTSFSSVALWSCWAHSLLIIFINSAEEEDPWSAVLWWRGDNWIISAGNQLGFCACDGTRVKQRLGEREGVGGWSIILDTPLPHIPPFSPSCSRSPRSPSIAYLMDKGDQIAHFHLKDLSPNKRQGSGDRL